MSMFFEPCPETPKFFCLDRPAKAEIYGNESEFARP